MLSLIVLSAPLRSTLTASTTVAILWRWAKKSSFFVNPLRILAAVFCLAVFLGGCTRAPRVAENEEDLRQALMQAVREGDADVLARFAHPSSDPEIIGAATQSIAVFFSTEFNRVASDLLEPTDLPDWMPGQLDGKPLEYTASLDGIILIRAAKDDELDPASMELFMPYTIESGVCYIAPVSYADRESNQPNKSE